MLADILTASYIPRGKLWIWRAVVYRARFLRLNKLVQKINKLASDQKSGKLLSCYYSPYGVKDVYDLSFFDDFIYYDFEGRKFRDPKDYDKRLTQLYGDYMELPPKADRRRHVTKAYWVDEI